MNKKIIASIITIITLVGLLITNYLLFDVSDIRVSQTISQQYPEGINDDKIIKDSKIKKNQLIFSVDTDKVKENIEIQNSKILVLKVEKKFPGKILIHITNRQPVYRIKIKDSSMYALVDKELKILEITDKELDYKTCEIIGFEIAQPADGNLETLKQGKVGNQERLIKILEGFSNIGITSLKFNSFINQIDISSPIQSDLYTNTGARILLQEEKDGNSDYISQIKSLYSHYDSIRKEDPFSEKLKSGYQFRMEKIGDVWGATVVKL